MPSNMRKCGIEETKSEFRKKHRVQKLLYFMIS